MRSFSRALLVPGLVVVSFLVGVAGASQSLPDLVIDTTTQLDVIPGGVKIEPEISGRLHMYRSYLMAVKIRNIGALTETPFNVRTECQRGSNRVTLGEGRIALLDGDGYALYNIFPSSAGQGRCALVTRVDARNEVKESSEGQSTLSGQTVSQVYTLLNIEIVP